MDELAEDARADVAQNALTVSLPLRSSPLENILSRLDPTIWRITSTCTERVSSGRELTSPIRLTSWPLIYFLI